MTASAAAGTLGPRERRGDEEAALDIIERTARPPTPGGRRGRGEDGGAARSRRIAWLGAWALAIGASASSTSAFGGELVVRVAGVGVSRGEVRVALFSGEAAFETRTAYRATALGAVGPALEVRFPDVPPGEYAVLVHHDVDGDGTLDRGRFGIPSEPWAGSTSGTRFRAPSWEAYAFDVPSEGASISVVL